jgi:hypothetical protein
MKKSELKQMLKPLIKECIKEVIFEEGILSGLITEVAQGLGNIQLQAPVATPKLSSQKSERTLEAKNQLNEMKSQLQKATGLHGIFENTKPIPSGGRGETGKYGALRDKDPSDSGVNIDGLMKLTGGWSHRT